MYVCMYVCMYVQICIQCALHKSYEEINNQHLDIVRSHCQVNVYAIFLLIFEMKISPHTLLIWLLS